MAKAVIYSDEQVIEAQQALRTKTARKVGKTRSQVAEFLADDIRKAIEQGYSLKDIKNILAEAGISVSVAKIQAILERQEGSEKTPSTRLYMRKRPITRAHQSQKIEQGKRQA